MGRIIERIQRKVKDNFEQEQDPSDISRKIDEDGMGFSIKRYDGKSLVYDGNSNEFSVKED